MSDSSAVDGALFSALADPTLAGLLPDGVYLDTAPQGKTKFVVVSMPAHEDVSKFDDDEFEGSDGTAFERFTYLVKAVVKDTRANVANAAAVRIKVVVRAMTGQIIPGYVIANAERVERVAYTENDPDNVDTRWQHRGGLYQIMASPTA